MLHSNPKNLAAVFAVTSVLFLSVLAISPLKDAFSEWRLYQHEFNRLLEQQPARVDPVKISIKQTWIPELGVTDRCVSCHLGISNEKLVGMPPPYTPHPSMYHDPEEFGCTPCHRGQGIATTVLGSQGEEEFWEEPMYPMPFIEAGCGWCHEEDDVPDAPILSHGRRLIREMDCVGCHEMETTDREYVVGLDGIGSKTNRDWLMRWLRSPNEVRPGSKMPDFDLSSDEIQLLADFLMTFTTFPGKRELKPLPKELEEEWPDETLVKLGQARFREARCISCHLINDKGGRLAPELGTVASKVERVWLYNFIGDPRGLHPGIGMPQYGFARDDVVAVTAYILSEFRDWDLEDATPDQAHVADHDFYRKGLALFNDYNCLGCHTLTTEGAGRNMGPTLKAVGTRPYTELEFDAAQIEHTRSSFLFHKLKDPNQFSENSRMPVYSFDEDELRAVTTALLAMRGEPAPKEFRRHVEAPPPYKPEGEFGRLVRKYTCFSCHVINGTGFLLTTDLSLEGSRVHRDWLEDYFKVPYTLRPVLTERMPNLFLTDEERRGLTDYIDKVFVSDALDSVHIPTDIASISRGRHLVHNVYGCITCHQVNGKGGYVGPPLDEAAKRDKPGWIYEWILNPQKYRPDTIDPNAGLTPMEAKQITAYILSLEKT